MAAGAANVQSSAQTRREGFLYQEHSARAGFDGGVDDAALLYLGHAGGYGDDHTGLGSEEGRLRRGLKHFLKHPDGHFMVGYGAVLQRVHGDHVAGSTTQHVPRGRAHLQNLAGVLVHGHNRGFPDDQSLAVGVNQNIGCTKVNAQIIGK